MATRYRLVFRGKYLPGLGHADVVANLAALFGVPAERVELLLASCPAIIKQDVDIDAGNRYLDALAEAGLITHLESLGAVDGSEVMAGGGWDGVEHRSGSRRQKNRDRRDVRRGAAIQPDRRGGRGRRETD